MEPAASPPPSSSDRPPPPRPSIPPPPVPHEPTIVSVEVVALRPDEVEVRLADGRTGIIDRRDFAPSDLPGTGDVVEAAVLARDDPAGRVRLSHAWARKHRAWRRVLEAQRDHDPVTGTVRRVVKGGVVVDVDGLRAFLPGSLVDDAPVEVESLVGEEVEVSVVEADRTADRLVVSRRDVLRRERRRREKEVLAGLEPGGRVSGRVLDLLDFGARVDLGGGLVGLVHRSELSWGHLEEVSEAVSPGETIEVVVLEVQRSRRRVALSLRRTTPDPLEAVSVGDVTDAEVTRVVEYGAFARLAGSALEGLIHLSELTDQPGVRPRELVVPGEVVRVKVIEVDRDRRRLGLSVTQAILA